MLVGLVHIVTNMESRFPVVLVLWLGRELYRDIQPQDLDMEATGWPIHPSEHLEPNQISLEDGVANIVRKDIINIFTYGSKAEHEVGAAF
ncbi:hypothetical protein AVEN_187487-1 [Araneus ventricosus]|uniref:Uncharacterized protein n=1 Tax=Araneus ventricosus TaxID=182803 RepID=A0A4Y2BU41_ARAVE|nr:hypothetical protein AVEN_187487-1 [Araneus ventricosus]